MANYINYTYLTPLSGYFKEKIESTEYGIKYGIQKFKLFISEAYLFLKIPFVENFCLKI